MLPVVRTIEAQMASDPMLDHEYLPILGLRAFRDAATRLLLGADSPAITKNRVSIFFVRRRFSFIVCLFLPLAHLSCLHIVCSYVLRCVLYRPCQAREPYASDSTFSSASTTLKQSIFLPRHGVCSYMRGSVALQVL